MMELIKQLREKTGAGVLECRRALMESKGDINKAIQIIKEKGMEIALQKAERVAKEGRIEAYIHFGEKLGVLVEINCETDFVARNELFKKLCRDIAMQIAATDPVYIKPEDIPEEILDEEKKKFKDNFSGSNDDFSKEWEDYLNRFKKEKCLLEQPFIRDERITVREYINSVIAQFGENIQVRRFTRYQLRS
ncbi:MAG: elongation factor Ts [Candidatus Omnitrophica bacterium]|nr:elongation factor Ts [Candidatus Omnitrophota bacterium]MCM8792931.1 elongation factor Ts [Candidatus Omnitrophota bacterium]